MQGKVSGFFLTLQSHYSLLNEATAMLCSLVLIGYGKHFLEFHNPQTEYLSESSFTVYIFHQSWLAVFALFLFSITDNTGIQIAGIIVLTFAATYLSYEAVRRFRVTRFLFGIKRAKASEAVSINSFLAYE